MSVYTLLNGVTAVQSAPGTAQADANGIPLPPGSNLPTGSMMVRLDGGAGESAQASSSQGFHAIAVATSGNCSATVVLLASNDGVNWFTYATITITSGATPVQGNSQQTGFFKYFSAYVSAITGTGTKVTCYMAA